MQTPGSPEAVELGCSCPQLDNGRGAGYLGWPNVFVHNAEECPLHPLVPFIDEPTHNESEAPIE